jgi:hypothetical protein
MKVFFLNHYNFIRLGLLIINLEIGRFYNAFASKYIWEINLNLLFWDFTIQINNKLNR